MKNTFTLFILCLFIPALHAQITFQKTYGGAGGESNCYVATTSDGGYALAGASTSTGEGNNDVYIVRTDSVGTVLWAKTYGGALGDQAYDIKQTNDGGFIISATTESFNGSRGFPALYLLRTDGNGDTLWTRTYTSGLQDIGWNVWQMPDSGFIVAGNYNNSSQQFLVRIKSNGDSLWTKINNAGFCAGIVLNDDKGFTTCGTGGLEVGGNGNEMYLCRMDSTGSVLWYKTYGGTNTEGGYGVVKGNDGGFVVLGFTASFTIATNTNDFYVVKTDTAGNVEWSKSYENGGSNIGYSIVATGDGYALYGSSAFNNGGSFPNLLIKIDNTGNVLWARNYEGILVGNIKQTADGGFALTGYNAFAPNTDFYLIKTDANGHSGCTDSSVAILVDTAATQVNTRAITEVTGFVAGNTGTVITDGSTDNTVICLSTGIKNLTIPVPGISVFPNPAVDEIGIAIDNNFGQVKSVELYNMLGQQVLVSTQTQKIQVAELPSGTYFIKVINAVGATSTVRFEKL